MSTINFKVESGIQLLTRLTRKPEIENFYPVLFQNGPKYGEVIELYSDCSTSFLLLDIISEALIPAKLGGKEAGVILFTTDGNLEFDRLVSCLRKKLSSRLTCSSSSFNSTEELNKHLHGALCNFYRSEIFDATQFYTTIHGLESIIVEHPNISLVLFDTLTAFYWSEQGFKITKMDVYVKNLLRMIQKVTKEYKITILYTRPEYFSSSKDPIENLEACCEQPTWERVNYRIQTMSLIEDGRFQVNVRTCNNLHKNLCTFEDEVKWL